MDEVQKTIIGYLLMAVIGALIFYLGGKLELWLHDPSLLIALGIILAAIETSAYKWIRYTFNLPEEEEEELNDVLSAPVPDPVP
jgi:hypothetical protein